MYSGCRKIGLIKSLVRSVMCHMLFEQMASRRVAIWHTNVQSKRVLSKMPCAGSSSRVETQATVLICIDCVSLSCYESSLG
jgi:hypothetical protein